MKLFAAGIGHKTAPVEPPEQLAVKQSDIVDLAFVPKCFGHLDEIVLLSTRNRVEIYGTTQHATRHIKSLLQLLCAEPRDLDPKWGEIVKAFVVLRLGEKLSAEELVAYCRKSLAKYKIPRSIEFVETELPKSGSGKILKRILLRDSAWADQERAVA